MTIDIPALTARLLTHEGLRLFPYTDTTGHITIGVGRNLSADGMSRDEAMLLLSHDVQAAIENVQRKLGAVVQTLDPVRGAVLVELAFNLGIDGLLAFEHMLEALDGRNFPQAAADLVQSLAASEEPTRFAELAQMLRTGVPYDQ